MGLARIELRRVGETGRLIFYFYFLLRKIRPDWLMRTQKTFRPGYSSKKCTSLLFKKLD
jgi:hypothetical protein